MSKAADSIRNLNNALNAYACAMQDLLEKWSEAEAEAESETIEAMGAGYPFALDFGEMYMHCAEWKDRAGKMLVEAEAEINRKEDYAAWIEADNLVEYMGMLYGFDEDYLCGAWLILFADYEWYFLKEKNVKTFIGLMNEISKYADAEEVAEEYQKQAGFSDMYADKSIQFLAAKLVELIEQKGEEK